MITMWDAIDITQIPPNPAAVAGYTSGRWPTYNSLVARFPHAQHLSIAISADQDADCLDIEPGDAVPAQAAAWVTRQLALGKARPCLYASAGTMGAVLAGLKAAGIDPGAVRLWSAHYGAGEHICGPGTCRLVTRAMDGTQWTNAAMGRELDQSLLADDFFDGHTDIMTQLPQLKQGATGQPVRNWQGLLNAHGAVLRIDGAFGPVTFAATKDFQVKQSIGKDGIVGPVTWKAALLG